MGNLQQLWDAGMEEAITRVQSVGTVEDAAFETGEVKQYSTRDNHLLNGSEYARFKRTWESRKRNYFVKRPNSGILIDMGNLLVYTDRKGMPQHVLEVLTDDLWTDNDIVQKAMLLETEGYDIDEQQEILESTCGAGSFRFRVPGDSGSNRRETGTGKRQDSRNVRRTDREEQPDARTPDEVRVNQVPLRDDEYMVAVNPDFVSSAMEVVDELESPAGQKPFSLRSMTEDCRNGKGRC